MGYIIMTILMRTLPTCQFEASEVFVYELFNNETYEYVTDRIKADPKFSYDGRNLFMVRLSICESQ